jgi:nucleotide-binding universal stress UspA family protein
MGSHGHLDCTSVVAGRTEMRTAASRSPFPAARPTPASSRDTRTFLPIRRILCPVDFSGFSGAAVDHAVALAKPFGAEITALFVLPLFFPEEAATCSSPVAPEAGVLSAIAEDLEEFLRPAREAGLGLRLCVRSGDCVGHILDEARDRESDLIVMGTHGRSGFERSLGSVTDGVLRKAPCPVVAVPRQAEPGPAPARIVCAVRLSAHTARTASYALSLAGSTGSRVTLVYVWDGVGGPRFVAACEACEAALRRRLHAVAVADGPPPCAVQEVVVIAGRADREILRLAEAQQAGLIVLGSDDQGPGSTARRVLREAPCPVLTVRRG